MPLACPSDESLQAFAAGRLSVEQREAIATHVRTCVKCQAKFLPIALQTSKLETTFLDSPRALERRTSHDALPAVPPSRSDGLEDTHVSSAHRDPSLATSLHTGDALDRYVILERLGAGGMGEVYTAWDPVLDRKVAVKILRGGTHDPKLGEEMKARLLREAQALARLSHPNVVTIHDVGVTGEQVYLAMEFVQGQTLTAWLKQSPRTWREILEVFLAAGEGLMAAHEVGITHRDFKPDNVVVSRDGRARVMDFGLAHARAAESPITDSPSGLNRSITDPGTMMGTPAYMSPEAMYGRATDFRSDQFSFCVALYEALYGHRPFEGTTTPAIAAEIEVNRVKPPPKDTKVPRRIHELLLRGLRRQPDQRFQTLRALLVQLGRRKGSRRRTLLVLGLAAVVAVSVGVNAWLVRRDRQRCANLEARLDGVWDEASKAAIQRAFLASQKPWAATAWRDVERRLELYAKRWVALRRSACEAQSSQATDEALGQNLVCLSRRYADLQAVSSLFVHADADIVERAVATASALPPLEECLAPLPGAAPKKPEREELRGALAAVKARIDAGRYAEALQLARALGAKATALGEDSTLAEARIDEAVALMRQGDARAADALLEEALLIATRVGDDELVARAWVERLGAAAISEKPQAEQWARFAEAALVRAPTPELEASLANNRGVLAWVSHRYEEAIAAHGRALALRQKLFGEQHVLVAKSHSNLGTAWKALGRYDAAVAEYELALEIEELVLDPTHPAVAETLNNLGNALHARGDRPGARMRLEKALEIKERAFGDDALTVAVTLTNLGVLLMESGDLESAELALSRAVAIKEQRSAAPSSLALTLTNLAKLRRDQRRWRESVALDTRALELRQSRGVESAYNLTGLGRAKLELADLSAARVHLEAALALWPKGVPERAESMLVLARVVLKREPTLARRLLQEIIDGEPEGSPLQREARALRGNRR